MTVKIKLKNCFAIFWMPTYHSDTVLWNLSSQHTYSRFDVVYLFMDTLKQFSIVFASGHVIQKHLAETKHICLGLWPFH